MEGQAREDHNSTNESDAAVQMILTDKFRGWKVALRKLLTMTFGPECLANSCAVGKSNARFEKLNKTKLRQIKGTYMQIN